jgi:ankyrin repeat protein
MDYKNKYNELFELIKLHENKKFMNKINELINNDYSFDINITDEQEKYFLTHAVITNNIEIALFLIDKGARIDIEDEDIPILIITIIYSLNDMLKLLLDANKKSIGVGLVNYRDKNNRIPLYYAINKKNITAINLLLEYGSNVNLFDKDKYNSLFYSIKSRSIEICKKVIKFISNINAKSVTGENCLHVACNFQLYDISNLLIENKIKINVHDYKTESTPLHYCVLLNNMKLTELLVNNGANINLQDIYGNTPLHYSIMENNHEIFNYLLNINCNMNLWNIDGKIPLHQVLLNNNNNFINGIESMIEKSNINIQDKNGNSCFYYLLKLNLWKKYLSVLKKKKINVFLKNKNNEYIFDLFKDYDTKDKELIYDLLINSYFYILKNTNKNWTDELDIKCSGNIDADIIQQCKLKIKDKLELLIKKAINNEDIKCYEKSYPMVRPSICVELSEGKDLQICTFTGNLLDVLFGLVFLTNTHKEHICSVINDKINKYDLCSKYKLDNIISDNNKCELINFEIIWSNKNLHFGEFFIENFVKCISNNKKKFIIVPLGIEMKEGSHAGYLIYDIAKKELERFETYGSGISLYGTHYDANLLDEKIEQKFKELNDNIKYIKPYDFLPKISFQLSDILEKQKKKIGDPFGFCALWSIWYVDNRIKYNEIPREKLVEILINNTKEKNISFKNMIRNYAINIINIRDNILKKANIDINDWLNEQYTEKQFFTIVDEINKEISKFN